MKKRGANRNTTDKATFIGDVVLNTITAVTIIAVNEDRTALVVSNPTNRDIWLQFEDDLLVFSNTILLLRGETYTMPDNIYNGEIKAIALLGTPTVTIVEY